MGFVRTLEGGPLVPVDMIGINNDRYFHVTGQGWYALTREGLGGPFVDKREAEIFVYKAIAGELLPENQYNEEATG